MEQDGILSVKYHQERQTVLEVNLAHLSTDCSMQTINLNAGLILPSNVTQVC